MMRAANTILIIVPTYNERENIGRLLPAVWAAMPSADILVVDDSSPDGTAATVQAFASDDSNVHLLTRPGKQGLGRAYQAGFGWALARSYQKIVTMDADFSHDPQHLPQLTAACTDDVAIVVGSRYVTGGQIVGWTRDRYWLSSIANRVTKLLLGLEPKDVTAGYKCYSRAFLESLDLAAVVSPGYAFQVEMITLAHAAGFPVTELPITFHDRTVGRSKVSRHELISSATSLFHLVMRRRGFREAGKFGAVGLLNIGVDLGITNLLILAAHLDFRYAGYIGTGIALMSSFVLNRQWTFRTHTNKLSSQLLRFLLINGTGAALNVTAYTFLLPFKHYNLAKLVAIAVAAIWNFLGTKYWVFGAARADFRQPAVLQKPSHRSQPTSPK